MTLTALPVSFDYNAENQALAVCLRGGDIGHLPIEDGVLGQVCYPQRVFRML